MAARTKVAPGRLERNQEGQVLTMSLVLLLLVVLIVTPLLGYMSTGFTTGKEYQKKADELYAADAGVREAIWNIRNNTNLPPVGRTTGQDGIPALPLVEGSVGGKTVSVTIFCRAKGVAGGTYKITSVATSNGGSSRTTIEAWIDFEPGFWDYAVVTTPKPPSDGIYMDSGTTIDGKAAGDLTGPGGDPGGDVTGANDGAWDATKWPFGADLRTFFNTPDLIPYASNKLDLGAPCSFGTIYRDGDLAINNTGIADATATLNGTVYVAGSNSSLLIGQSNQGFVLNMGTNSEGLHNAIYVEGENKLGNSQFAIDIGPKTTIEGSGVIVAEGNINFQPNIVGTGGFLFIMSLNGYVNFHPSGTFSGSIAGYAGVQMGPGTTIAYTPPPIDLLNFPSDPNSFTSALIRSWKVIPPLALSSPALYIVTGSLPGGSVGVAYSETLVASGGVTPYTWSISGGSLPPNLSLNSSTGAITGMLTTAGTFEFTVGVTDSASPPVTVNRGLSITVDAAFTITTSSPLPDGYVGVSYNQTLAAAASGVTPYTWSLQTDSTLPANLTLSSGGVISGTPLAAGPYNFTVQVTDNASPTPKTATKAFSLTVAVPTPPSVVTNAATIGPGAKKATLNGTLTGLGSATSVTISFEWGIISPGGTPAPGIPSTSTVPTSFNSAQLTGLRSGATYYYRAKAVGNNGLTTYGAIVTFVPN